MRLPLLRPNFLFCIAMLAAPLAAGAAEVIVAQWPVELDGYLREWGAAERIAIEPGGPEIGLRGVFHGAGDHEADVFAMWDAEFLYVAAAVTDSVVDIGRVRPDEKVWRGPTGVRKDRMFYFDHFKLFIREHGAALGHHLWIAPKQPDGKPYAWGHRQRMPGDERVPVGVGSELVESVYTFELAIPWSWLEIDPRPDMYLNASALLVDSDLPGVEVRDKIKREAEKWIWWEDVLQLKGTPPNLRTHVAFAGADAQRQPATQQDDRLRRAMARVEERARLKDAASAPLSSEVGASPQATERKTAPGPTGDDDPASVSRSAPAAEKAGEASTSSTNWRDQLRRLSSPTELAAPTATQLTWDDLPDWVRVIPRDPKVNETHVISYVITLRSQVSRLLRERVEARTDILVYDMAASAGTMRFVARDFLLDLLAGLQVELRKPDGDVPKTMVEAARDTGVDEEAALRFAREIVTYTHER